ncbi:MAG: ankyrin repeat domain-containing protein [Rhodospirillales bacterium]|nr:ankyrin repeat domain-containing protein [Alphaproteobacteria bacterium]MCB9987229.1 ankyrin repeat domain-containing protein [Rhodospirillales bacterium]USO07910.1 MAG: ankyrin repeat domain-containing protein [Rhodospirillales bacterium]
MNQDEIQKALWDAAKKGDREKIRMLVVAGADVTAEDADGRTALHIASQNGQGDAYKTLLAAREMQELMKAGITPAAALAAKAGSLKSGGGREAA